MKTKGKQQQAVMQVDDTEASVKSQQLQKYIPLETIF